MSDTKSELEGMSGGELTNNLTNLAIAMCENAMCGSTIKEYSGKVEKFKLAKEENLRRLAERDTLRVERNELLKRVGELEAKLDKVGQGLFDEGVKFGMKVAHDSHRGQNDAG